MPWTEHVEIDHYTHGELAQALSEYIHDPESSYGHGPGFFDKYDDVIATCEHSSGERWANIFGGVDDARWSGYSPGCTAIRAQKDMLGRWQVVAES